MVKKAQLKIQQMAFMLIAVTLFFVLVAMFIITIKFSGLKESATVLEEKNAMLLVTKLANSPEFSCGEAYGANRINCVDSDKIMVLKENIYEGFWDVSNIEIRKIYPKEDTIICTSGNYPNCNVIKVKSDEVTGNYLSNFVSLCRKESFEGEIYDKCEVAKLMVSYETK
jgi:hypothetical protein|tara:strand:- start:12007 stop:12513 length:507 start_codon:yes stop_codon:yes gene_type:complete